MRGLLWIGLVGAFAIAGGHVLAEATIPIVHTWGDLENAPKITVVPSPWMDKGETSTKLPPVTFQVGVQSNEATSYGGIVLYYLEQKGNGAGGTPEERGLYFTEVDNDKIKGWAQDAMLVRSPQTEPKDGSIFYAETLTFGGAGDYVVKLVRPYNRPGVPDKPVVLADLKIHVTDHPQELWYPWWSHEGPRDGIEAKENPDGSRYAFDPVVNPKSGAAVPKPPRPCTYAALPKADQSLPVLVSDVVDEQGVQLKMTDSTLVVKFAQQIEGYFPDDHFLTRWWVNGKQVDLDPAVSRPLQARCLGAQAWFTPKGALLITGAIAWDCREVHFELYFKPERMVVKKGDQVGVQLLFCPSGFKDTGMQDEMLAVAWWNKTQPVSESFSEMSNRVDFVYSGDPEHPQK